MKKKRLILHIGQHKTGSTSLQYFFSKYHESLKKNNIDYPYPEGENVLNTGSCVGNLVKILFEEKLYKEKIKITQSIIFRDIWKDEYVVLIKEITEKSSCDTVIFSSEGVSGLNQKTFEKMKNYLEKFFDVEYILFVRDPYESCYSNWKQWLKVNFIQEDFKTFTDNLFVAPNKFNAFNVFENIITKSINITFINYDTYKHKLAEIFFEVTHLDFKIPDDYESRQLFNRSFTDSEAAIQLLINRQFKNTSFPFHFRVLLLQRKDPSINSSGNYYDKEIHALILSHMKEKFAVINKMIYGESIALEVKEVEGTKSPLIDLADAELLIETLTLIRKKSHRKISLSARFSHYYKCVRKKNIPFSFDPEAYLDMNQDVKDSGMDPYEHYTQYGIYENRTYKYI